MFYDVYPILFAVKNVWGSRKFPSTLTVHRCTGYVFVCVYRCVRTSVHVTKPPFTQSMTPFFLIYVLYSVLMYLYSLNSLYTPCVCMHVYRCTLICLYILYICVQVCGNLQYISQYPTHSMYIVFYNVIYIPTYVHQCNVTLGHSHNNFL